MAGLEKERTARLDIHKRIEKLIEKEECTQKEFAASLDLDPQKGRSTINNWVTGANNIKSDDIVRIAKKKKVSADWLLGLTEIDNWSSDESVKISSDVTGLGNGCIDYLNDLKRRSALNPGGEASRILRAINLLLDGDKEETQEFWRRIQAFLFATGGDYNLITEYGTFGNLPRDAILRSLLELNNDYLQTLKTRLENDEKEAE